MAQADRIFTFSRFFIHRLQASRLQLADIFPDREALDFPLSEAIPSVESQRRRLTSLDSRNNPFNLPASRIRALARSSPSHSRFARFMAALIQIMNCKQVLETGTSFGLTTAYLAHADQATVTSIERESALLDIARETCENYSNINLIFGSVSDYFDSIAKERLPDLVFLDADHRSEVVLSQISYLLNLDSPPRIIIVHDIYWSRDMHRGWEKARVLPGIQSAVDLYEAGLLLTGKCEEPPLLKRYI